MPLIDVVGAEFRARFLRKGIHPVVSQRQAVVQDGLADERGLRLVVPQALVAQIPQQQKRGNHD